MAKDIQTGRKQVESQTQGQGKHVQIQTRGRLRWPFNTRLADDLRGIKKAYRIFTKSDGHKPT